MVLARIMDEVTDYKNNYEQSYESYFDIAHEAAVEFYKLLMEDVEALCEDVIKNMVNCFGLSCCCPDLLQTCVLFQGGHPSD
jgi:hypothetical protein